MTLLTQYPRPLCWPAISLFIIGLALSTTACDDPPHNRAQPAARCSAEVIDESGRFWAVATASAGSPQRPLQKQAFKAACEQLCQQQKPAPKKGCLARCQVDIDAAKVGARVSCEGTQAPPPKPAP